LVAAAGEQAAVVKDGFGVAVVRVDLPSAPLQTRMLFAVKAQIPIDGGYDCGVDDVNEIAVFVQLKY